MQTRNLTAEQKTAMLQTTLIEQLKHHVTYLQAQHGDRIVMLPRVEIDHRVATHAYLSSEIEKAMINARELEIVIEDTIKFLYFVEAFIKNRVPQSCEEVNAHYTYRQAYAVLNVLRNVAGMRPYPLSVKMI